jgi:hypothetical protein
MSESDKNNDSPKRKTKKKHSRKNLPFTKWRTSMDVWMNLFIGLGVISGGVMGLVGIFTHWQNKQSVVIWAFYAVIVCAITVIFLAWQKNIWEIAKAEEGQNQPTIADVIAQQSKNAEDAERRHREERRARIGIGDAALAPSIRSGVLFVGVKAINNGETEALNVKTKIFGEIAPLNKIPEGEREIPRIGLPDNALLARGAHTLLELGPIQLTTHQMIASQRPDMGLYIWGWITYDDIFGESHRTSFCFVNPDPGGTNLWSCATGNDAN